MENTILIVDDDKEIVRTLAGYFEQAGFQTRYAYNGTMALNIIRAENITLLVLDLMLPDKDGWDITRIIRSDQRIKNLPIIMLTARVRDSDKLTGLDLGADDYIVKPFNPHEVIARTRAVLRRVQPQSANIIQIDKLLMDTDSQQISLDNKVVDLTPTEYLILKTLMHIRDF